MWGLEGWGRQGCDGKAAGPRRDRGLPRSSAPPLSARAAHSRPGGPRRRLGPGLGARAPASPLCSTGPARDPHGRAVTRACLLVASLPPRCNWSFVSETPAPSHAGPPTTSDLAGADSDMVLPRLTRICVTASRTTTRPNGAQWAPVQARGGLGCPCRNGLDMIQSQAGIPIASVAGSTDSESVSGRHSYRFSCGSD